ncbi:glycerol-3-phosphate 1-O-acyltransferase PlsY [Syntrophomonas curvata]
MREFLLILLCYLIGSIPFSYIAARVLAHTDVRTRGSGNVGATNVFRTSGTGAALLALAGDLIKGVLAAWLGLTLGGLLLAALCSLAAVIGHCYPLFLRFRGGKAVATAGGVVLWLMPKVVIILLLIFIAVVYVSRYVSLASIAVAVLLPVIALMLHNPWEYILLSVLMAALVVYRHRENIRKLRQGTEARIGDRA